MLVRGPVTFFSRFSQVMGTSQANRHKDTPSNFIVPLNESQWGYGALDRLKKQIGKTWKEKETAREWVVHIKKKSL